MEETQIEVALFSRRARDDQRSIESLFRKVSGVLAPNLNPVWRELPYFSTGIWRRLKAMLWARKRQCHVNHIIGDVHFLALILDPKKTVLTIHDCGFIHKKRGLERWIMKKIWLDIPVNRVSKVTTVSESSKSDIVSLTGCDPEKVEVIYNFVTDAFRRRPERNSGSQWTILQIGTKENKNLPGLISAIQGLDCKLIVVGRLNDEQRALLQTCRINYDNHFDLEFDELTEIYQTADMLACISFEEGFGLPIIEAQKSGVPVVTSRLSAMPEVAGSGALYVDPNDREDIRGAIDRLKEDPMLRSKLVEEGMSNVKRFTLDRAASLYSKLYFEIAGK